MATSSVLLLLVCTFMALQAMAAEAYYNNGSDDGVTMKMFEEWMAKFGKTYKCHGEKEHRFGIFRDNFHFIQGYRSQANYKSAVGINQFADLTNEEFVATYTGAKPPHPKEEPLRTVDPIWTPCCIDWRYKGAVTGVKDQGSCGKSLGRRRPATAHCVIYVTGKKYWIAKNSWGKTWGQEGYILLEKDVADPHGTCGLAVSPFYPVV
ncbi:hypothetical protein ABZP36_027432 [Zizania latifolia]